MTEYGIVIPPGIGHLTERLPAIITAGRSSGTIPKIVLFYGVMWEMTALLSRKVE